MVFIRYGALWLQFLSGMEHLAEVWSLWLHTHLSGMEPLVLLFPLSQLGSPSPTCLSKLLCRRPGPTVPEEHLMNHSSTCSCAVIAALL